jgi:hypothetical protein
MLKPNTQPHCHFSAPLPQLRLPLARQCRRHCLCGILKPFCPAILLFYPSRFAENVFLCVANFAICSHKTGWTVGTKLILQRASLGPGGGGWVSNAVFCLYVCAPCARMFALAGHVFASICIMYCIW